MSREDGGFGGKGLGKELERFRQLKEVATRQIGSPSRTLKERIAREAERRFPGAFD